MGEVETDNEVALSGVQAKLDDGRLSYSPKRANSLLPYI